MLERNNCASKASCYVVWIGKKRIQNLKTSEENVKRTKKKFYIKKIKIKFQMQNKLISSRFGLLRVYKEKIVLKICPKNNLISDRIIDL